MGLDSGKASGWVQPATTIGIAAAGAGTTAAAAGAVGAISWPSGIFTATSAGSAGSGAFLGIGPVGWGLIGASLLGAYFLRGKKKSPPPEAKGIVFGQAADANAPWLKVYGQPWLLGPPLLSQYAQTSRMGTTVASGVDVRKHVEGRAVSVLHVGAGPVAGTGLDVRYGGRRLASKDVTASSADEQQALTVKGSDYTVFLLPHADGEIVAESIAVFVDGVPVYAANGSGSDPTHAATVTVDPTYCKAENFLSIGLVVSNRDSDIPSFETRAGCYLPRSGLIDDRSISATVHLGQATSRTSYYFSGSKRTSGAASFALVPDDWGQGFTDDGKQYFYVRRVTNSANGGQAVAVSGGRGILGFTLGYDVSGLSGTGGDGTDTNTVKVFKQKDGSFEAHFALPVASTSAVTATYRVDATFDGATYSMRNGGTDQRPFADDADDAPDSTRNTVLVGTELTKGTPVGYSTTDEVDDILLGFESGPKGFYGTDSDGTVTGLGRGVAIDLRESDAPSTGGTGGDDPAKGWVRLRNPDPDPKYGDFVFRFRDLFTGTGQWWISCAAALAYTRGGKTGDDPTMPAKTYSVRVTAQDAAGTPESGYVNADRYFSNLFLANVTEVRRVGFVLPGQATVTVAVGPDTEQGQRIDVRFAGALVVWPSSASETVTSAGLPKARTLGYSRNPVWCVCDLITDPHVGGGSFFDWNDIDIPSAYAAAAFCDEAVTLRDGTEQTRSLCDYVVGEGGERRSLGEWIAAMLAGSGVFAYWRSGKWFFVADEDSAVAIDPDTSSDFEIVEEEDCPAGSCELSYAGSEEIPSDLVVQFRDGENLDAESQEPIVFDDPQPTPRITERVEFPAVRRRTQAHWSGGILLRQMALARRSVRCPGTIGRGLRLLRLDPGDIVRFTSARLGLAAVKMRVMAVGWTSGMRPALDLVEHVSAAYTDSFAGPNSGVTPGQRAPSDSETPVPTQISVRHVSGHRALRTAGGAA